MKHCTSIPQLLSKGEDLHPAIGAPGQMDVNFKSLRAFITLTVSELLRL